MQTNFCYEYSGEKGILGNIYFKSLRRYTFIMPCNDTITFVLQHIALWGEKIKERGVKEAKEECVRLILPSQLIN